ncbi:amino acid racemase [Antarcticibacterium flavum]|uniref:Amino acid racemase n=1 Tax=Antarcticibacterium flavum TaxID=2058175 RepID=A0A5B7WZ93_9FLAO|nr:MULTISPECIES: amino acid racemase [Antarcticibacterium]MCM4158641.1 aspartate racemase [Antarcticibacterium sp. W02-3]QCY68496.1 amino acid racemase [Antarcticibacterium flavum]
MKKIGLIGGTSWHSTIVYYRLINEYVSEKIGTGGNPELLMYSINIELMREQNREKINHKYLEVAKILREAGAEAIVICANTPHMVYNFVQPQINIPILHIADAIGKEAEKLNLKTLGLLGNRPTMTGDFIPSRLKENYGIDIILPDPEYLDRNHHFVSAELTRGIFSKEAKNFFLEQMRLLKAKGAEGIILGCTELPILIEKEDINIPMIATTQLHVKMAADFILEK